MALKFESSLQNLVYQMDEGPGRKIIHVVLFALFAVAMAALTTFTNFQGLKDARAMEEAQLARNLVVHGRLLTQAVAPLSIGHMAERDPDSLGRIQDHPDLFHPPVWPVLLGALLRVAGSTEAGVPTAAQVSPGDYLPVGLSHFFTILSTLWVWAIGRKLFDARVANLSAGAFLVSDIVWRASLQGGSLSAAIFFSLGAVMAALWTAERASAAPPGSNTPPPSVWRWLPPLALSALLTAATILTRYAMSPLILAVFLYIGLSRHQRSWSLALLYFLLVGLFMMPWIARNMAISGRSFGLAPLTLYAHSLLFPGDSLFRMLNPELPDFSAALYAIQLKVMSNLREFMAQGFGLSSGGILWALFGAMYLHRFVRPSSRRLRWCLLPAAAGLVLVAAAYGAETPSTLLVLWPLAIPYAWAFFLVLLDRLQFEVRFFAAAALSVVMFLAGLPLLLNVLPPRTGLPYPPYFHRYIGWVSSMTAPDECMITDIPWAVAWYGGTTAIRLPRHMDLFFEIHENHHPVAVAYFTTVTRNKPWVRELSDPIAPEYSWYQIFSSGHVPSGFPLTHAHFIAGTDQLLLADRRRW